MALNNQIPSPENSPDFEFALSLSPRNSFTSLCHADELFYKGQLLPLQLSPRLSVVRTLRISSASSDNTSSRDSTDTALDHDEIENCHPTTTSRKRNFSIPKLPSLFRRSKNSSVKELVRKYLKKVKPLYEKLSQKQSVPVPREKTNESEMRSRPHSDSGNWRHGRRRSFIWSCPSSMGSSPSRSQNEYSELQSAIQNAIAHCKKTMVTS